MTDAVEPTMKKATTTTKKKTGTTEGSDSPSRMIDAREALAPAVFPKIFSALGSQRFAACLPSLALAIRLTFVRFWLGFQHPQQTVVVHQILFFCYRPLTEN